MNSSSNLVPLLLIGIFFIVVGIVAFLFLTAEEPTAVTDAPVVTEFPEGGDQEITPVFGVQSKTGSTIQTRNFLSDEGVVLYSESYQIYRIGTELGPDSQPLYEIFYNGSGSITVSLLNDDLVFARGRAEEKLQEVLGVTLLEMCSMEIQVTTPGAVSAEFSGQNLGLSSCPGSTQL